MLLTVRLFYPWSKDQIQHLRGANGPSPQKIGVGVLGFFGQQLFVLIYKVESASVGMFLRKAFDILVSFTFQLIFFSKIPTLNSILGATLISLAIMAQATKKILEEKLPADHDLRQKHLAFCFR